MVRRGAGGLARTQLGGACYEQRREACEASSNPCVRLIDDEKEELLWRLGYPVKGPAISLLPQIPG